MKKKVFWFNIENTTDSLRLDSLIQNHLYPVFVMDISKEWFQRLNQWNIPYYVEEKNSLLSEEFWRRKSTIILISSLEIKKELNEKNNDIEWLSFLEESHQSSPSDFLEQLQPLRDVVTRLLAPDGCPYDRKQTHLSLRRNLIEEAYEVIEAIELDDSSLLKEELGDLLLQVVFHAQLEEEKGIFSLDDVVKEISDKLIRRHPHVFSDAKSAESGASALATWEEMKKLEQGKKERGALDGIPPALPALLTALKLQEKAKKVGFDWDHVDQVWKKLKEEIQEFIEADSRGEKEKELGDLFFTIVNLGRFFSLDPELALRGANSRFYHRFRFVESQVNQGLKGWGGYSEKELNSFWEEAKQREN